MLKADASALFTGQVTAQDPYAAVYNPNEVHLSRDMQRAIDERVAEMISAGSIDVGFMLTGDDTLDEKLFHDAVGELNIVHYQLDGAESGKYMSVYKVWYAEQSELADADSDFVLHLPTVEGEE